MTMESGNDSGTTMTMKGRIGFNRRVLLKSRLLLMVVLCVLLLRSRLIKNGHDWQVRNEDNSNFAYQEHFLEQISGTKIRDFLKFYTARNHLAGSAADRDQAEVTAQLWRSFGWPSVQIETFYPVLNYLKSSPEVSLLKQSADGKSVRVWKATLRESSATDKNAVPVFHAYSAAGDFTAPLIYANYGTLQDFLKLQAANITTNGTIALVRYGKNFRGLKVRAAEQFGCVGVLVYSDPEDDGFVQGKMYPEGPWRPLHGIQRGSVHYNSIHPGDPFTPGWPALKNTTRLSMENATALPKIPSLPLSAADALPLLKALTNHGRVFSGWTGGFVNETQYFTGPSSLHVRLKNDIHYKIKPVWNVIAKIPGHQEPHRSVMLGNHRDAWGRGAVDPASGSAVLMEVARAMGHLYQTGWRPRRSVILASWDAEEYGMVGSTEHVEMHTDRLQRELVAYLNVDNAVSGPFFRCDATPSLAPLLYTATRRIHHPHYDMSLFEAWRRYPWLRNPPSPPLAFPYVGALGSGSDFTAFVNTGIPSINMAAKGPHGVYHSQFDTMDWIERFADGDYQLHKMVAQIWGLVAMELVDRPLLPMQYGMYPEFLMHDIQRLEQRVHTQLNITLSLDRLRSSLQKLTVTDWSGLKWLSTSTEERNTQLLSAERGFLYSKGIPGRSYYKHVIYAPGQWSGYGAAVFPLFQDLLDQWILESSRYTTDPSRYLHRFHEAESIIVNQVNQVYSRLNT